MPDEYTLGELVRRLTSITDQLSSISEQLRTDFVRKETYQAEQRALGREIRDLRQDIEGLQTARGQDASWRRSTSVTIAIAAIGWLVTIAIAILSLTAR